MPTPVTPMAIAMMTITVRDLCIHKSFKILIHRLSRLSIHESTYLGFSWGTYYVSNFTIHVFYARLRKKSQIPAQVTLFHSTLECVSMPMTRRLSLHFANLAIGHD